MGIAIKVIEEFIKSLTFNKPFSINLHNTLNTTKLVHALYRSSEGNKLVDVNSKESKRLGK